MKNVGNSFVPKRFPTNGGHGFYGEEVGLRERVHVLHARRPCGVVSHQLGVKVAMQEAEKKVVAGEHQPRDHKTHLHTE